jgi:imidazole glycerol phosphate synthase glutamine amidotransferase subunit
LVPTGTANTASVVAAFARLGAAVVEIQTPEEVASAPCLVLPGVGAFGAAMGQVDSLGLRHALRARVEAGRPTLAVCVGMQLLSRESEESPGALGLGVIDATVARFRGDLAVPQLGWNEVEPGPGCSLIEPGWAYFANSYRLEQVPVGWSGAITDYGGEFASALEKGHVVACQFHPELSGAWGGRFLGRWLELAGAAA